MAEYNRDQDLSLLTHGLRPMPERISQFLDRARALKLRIPFSPRQFRKAKSNSESKINISRRPNLIPPSRITSGLITEVFKTLFVEGGHLNYDLLENNIALCDKHEDLLLIEDADHYNLLHKAIIFGDQHLLDLLLDHGCDVNGLKSKEECWNGLKHCSHEQLGALHLASFLGRLPIVKSLLDHRADMSLQMRVYTSAAVNDPTGLQPDIFNSVQQSKATDIIAKCGCREAVFYAVLNNQVEVTRLLLQRQAEEDESSKANNRYLLHLACRVGAYECFEYLLGEYPRAVNTKDTDGLPLLLMALNNNTKFVKLLLEQECDIHVLDDFWEPGTNILHLLFHGVTTQNAKALRGLREVVLKCLSKGANVNNQRLPSKATPLHDLMRAVNCFTETSSLLDSDEFSQQYTSDLDSELIECARIIIEQNANVHIRDSNNKTPLQVLLSNGMHTMRCNASKDRNLSSHTVEALSSRSYGLDNTSKLIKLLIAQGAVDKNQNIPLMEDFVDLIQSSYFSSPDTPWYWMHSFEILREDAIFEKYIEIMELLLDAGADPNLASQSQLPPLLYLLSHIAESPYLSGYLVDVDTAHCLHSLISVLISHGAHTEAEIDVHGTGRRVIGCFDMLTSVLQTLRDHHRPVEDLEVLHVLATSLIQHGASTNVFQKLLYFIPERPLGRRASSSSMPKHTFLFQYILFGIFNLRYVNEGSWYMKLFNVLYCQIEHHTLNDVLAMAMAQFCSMHTADNDCECGQCHHFKSLLDSIRDKPRSLKILSRLAIYQSLQGRLEFKVRQLPLPNVLKKYLMTFEI